MKRAVIYCRISQDHTGEGAGVERQEQACRGLATARGWQVVSVEVDNSISASTGKVRPAWQRVLGMVERGDVDVVIAWHLDRITRTMLELEELIMLAQQKGVGVATATGDIDLTTDTGQMVARILAAVARAEVDRKAARQRAAHEQRAQQGRSFWTNRPFGYNRDGTLHEVEAPLVQAAYADLLSGRLGLNAIAQQWNKAGHLSTLGNPWRSSAVAGFLTNWRNAGVLVLRGERIGPGNWEALVDEDQVAAVIRLLDDPSRQVGGDGKRHALLSGLATCKVCGAAVVQTRTGKPRDGVRRRSYVCRDARHVNYPADWLDSYVTRKVIDVAEQWVEAVDETSGAPDVDLSALREEREDRRAARRALVDLVGDGSITAAEFRRQSDRIDRGLAEIDSALAAAAGERFGMGALDVELLWEWSGDVERFRPVLDRMVRSLELEPQGQGARVVDVDKVHLTLT